MLGHSKTGMFFRPHTSSEKFDVERPALRIVITNVYSLFVFFVSSLNSYLYHCFYIYSISLALQRATPHTTPPPPLALFVENGEARMPPFSLETIDVAMCFINSTLFSFIYYFSFWDAKELSTTKE